MIDYKANIELLKKNKVGDVINSDLVMVLMRTYSGLFLNGIAPNWCSRCLTRYYTEVVNYGLTQLEKMEEYKNRICVPNWDGLMYIHKMGRHYNNLYITDKEAIFLLENGHIKPSAFKILPYPPDVIEAPVQEEKIEVSENLENSEISPIFPNQKSGKFKAKKYN